MQKLGPDKVYFESTSIFGFNKSIISSLSVTKNDHLKFQNRTSDIIKEVSGKFDNVTVLDPTYIYCNNDSCPIGDGVNSYYFDRDHISIKGSEKLEGKLQSILSDLEK